MLALVCGECSESLFLFLDAGPKHIRKLAGPPSRRRRIFPGLTGQGFRLDTGHSLLPDQQHERLASQLQVRANGLRGRNAAAKLISRNRTGQGIVNQANLKQRIKQSVDDGFEAQLSLTADLVRCPSTRGNEHTAQDLMAREMRGARACSRCLRHGRRPDSRPSRRQPVLVRTFGGADRCRHSSPAPRDRPLAHPPGPCRCRAGGASRHVVASAFRSRHPQWLDVWPRRRRHEGGLHLESRRARCAWPASAIARPRRSMSNPSSRRNRPAMARS